MKQKVNRLYKDLFQSNHRYYILLGGRGAGRSTTASQLALSQLLAPDYFRCAIMRFVLGDIRNSIFQEIIDRAEESQVNELLKVTSNTLTIQYGENKINGVGFRKSSGEQKSKLKSLANYNCVIIEEADEVNEEDFLQLDDSLRTIKSDIKVILLLNPPSKNHWIIRRWFNLIDSEQEGFFIPQLKKAYEHDTRFFYTNYLDNSVNLDSKTKANFERYREINPDHYYNMVKGYISEGSRGRIFKNWLPISVKEFEDLPYPSIYGLDFGFSCDQSALTEIKIHNENIWVRELIYETGLTNQDLSGKFEMLGLSKESEIFADCAEPKSIEEIKKDGWNIKPATKGADSIRAGIDLLKSKQVYYTENSSNLIIEKDEYKWGLDKNKEPTNKPIDDYNHCFTFDTEISTNKGIKKIGEIKKGDKVLTRKGYKKVLKKWNNGNKQVVKYCLQLDTFVLRLECTPNHLILTQKGWIKVSKLKHGMTIYLIKNLMGKNTKQNTEESQNIVIQTVKLKHLEEGEKSKKEVFDLTIEEQHEYFANGILVHNCIDSLRYGVFTNLNKPFIGFV